MERKIFKVKKLYCCELGKLPVLFTIKDLGEILGEVLSDIHIRELVSFKMGVFQSMVFSEEKYFKYEKIACERMTKALNNGKLKSNYYFKGENAHDYLEDILTVYIDTYKLLDYQISPIDNKPEKLVQLIIKEKQSIIDKTLNRFGKTRDVINVMLSDILSIEGSTIEFVLITSNAKYYFDSRGVHY